MQLMQLMQQWLGNGCCINYRNFNRQTTFQGFVLLEFAFKESLEQINDDWYVNGDADSVYPYPIVAHNEISIQLFRSDVSPFNRIMAHQSDVEDHPRGDPVIKRWFLRHECSKL